MATSMASSSSCSALGCAAFARRSVSPKLPARPSQALARREAGGPFQAIGREIPALTRFPHALDVYAERHGGESAADIRTVLAEEEAHWRAELSARSGGYTTRAYPDPEGRYAALAVAGLRLQARLLGETGCRAEGVGAPARGSSPPTAANLLGMGTEPISGDAAGRITASA